MLDRHRFEGVLNLGAKGRSALGSDQTNAPPKAGFAHVQKPTVRFWRRATRKKKPGRVSLGRASSDQFLWSGKTISEAVVP